VAGLEEIWLRHLWQTFTYNKGAVPFTEWRRAIPLAGGNVRDADQFSSRVALALKREGSEGYWKKQLDLATGISPLDKAALYARLRRNEEAIQQLDQAYLQHQPRR
jgi:hypothetical protein